MTKELQNYHKDHPSIRSFGRIKSRKLSGHKNFLLQDFAQKYEISSQDFLCAQNQHNIFEIGFGFGDFLFSKAKIQKNKMFFACEPHLNGVAYLLAKIEKDPLENLKISQKDARELLTKFADNFFDEVYILFPDPWPKNKHFKRRLINQKFLDEILAPKIKEGAILTIATDHDSYKTWILASILQSKKFIWCAQSKKDWQNFPDDWVETKYQKKAKEGGRESVIFRLERM